MAASFKNLGKHALVMLLGSIVVVLIFVWVQKGWKRPVYMSAEQAEKLALLNGSYKKIGSVDRAAMVSTIRRLYFGEPEVVIGDGLPLVVEESLKESLMAYADSTYWYYEEAETVRQLDWAGSMGAALDSNIAKTIRRVIADSVKQEAYQVLDREELDNKWLLVTRPKLQALASVECGDADGNGRISITDVVYLIQYIFGEGNPPKCGDALKSVTIAWGAVGDDSLSGTATVYDIRYSTQPITDSNWNLATSFNPTPIPKEAGGIEICTITGLSADSIYYIAVKTADEAGNWSGISNVVMK